jgi:hypothetical protein
MYSNCLFRHYYKPSKKYASRDTVPLNYEKSIGDYCVSYLTVRYRYVPVLCSSFDFSQ